MATRHFVYTTGAHGTLTLNPDYLTSVTNRRPGNKSPDSGNSSGENSVNNSLNSQSNSMRVYTTGYDSLQNSFNGNDNYGGSMEGPRGPSNTAPARLGMWEDHRNDKFLQVIKFSVWKSICTLQARTFSLFVPPRENLSFWKSICTLPKRTFLNHTLQTFQLNQSFSEIKMILTNFKYLRNYILQCEYWNDPHTER